jgi:hypothetical protein
VCHSVEHQVRRLELVGVGGRLTFGALTQLPPQLDGPSAVVTLGSYEPWRPQEQEDTRAKVSPLIRTVSAIRYVTPLREGGSLPGLVEADDDGLYVVKFRAAGQGTKALIAEVVVGRLGAAIGLPVPELVLSDIALELGRAEPDPEVRELLMSSRGTNFGIDFLPGALEFTAGANVPVEPEFAADVVWLDAFTTNVDRTPRNPNLLIWHGRTWLIDHGAALYRHHSDRPLAERAREPFPLIRDHVLLPAAGSIIAADERLVSRIDEGVIEQALADVPDDWLDGKPADERRTYLEYLMRRLDSPRGFVEEAEALRVA